MHVLSQLGEDLPENKCSQEKAGMLEEVQPFIFERRLIEARHVPEPDCGVMDQEGCHRTRQKVPDILPLPVFP